MYRPFIETKSRRIIFHQMVEKLELRESCHQGPFLQLL